VQDLLIRRPINVYFDMLHQCFSIFSVNRNPSRQFWLLMEPPPHQLEGLGECCKLPSGARSGMRPQIYFGPTKSLENTSSGRKCRAQFNFFTEHRQSRRNLGYHWRNP